MTNSRRDVLKVLAGGTAFLAVSGGVAFARAPEVYIHDGGVFGKPWTHAVNGHDVVAYFSLEQDADPVPGSDDFITTYKDVTWRFSSQENLDAFVAEPEKYAPQYGGYCAWAMARNNLAKGDPAAWHVREGKLYLNVSKGIRRKFRKNIEEDIANASKNWPGILDTK